MFEPATAQEITHLQRAYFDGERLTAMPKRGRRRHLVLEQMVQIFEPGRRYTEIEVNRALRPVWDDVAALRRYLVDAGLLGREAGEYWRTGGPVPIEGPADRMPL